MFDWLLGILFPIHCVGCNDYDTWLCQTCQTRYCVPILQPGMYAVALYQPKPIQQLIHHLKYHGYISVSHKLSGLLYQSINWNDIDIVIPVPLHWRKRLTRGYNQTELLVRDWPVTVLPALKKIKATPSQAKLNKMDRQKNLLGAFVLQKRYQPMIQDKRILLVDDVYSTGSTTATCTEVLLSAGAKAVVIAVIALNVKTGGEGGI